MDSRGACLDLVFSLVCDFGLACQISTLGLCVYLLMLIVPISQCYLGSVFLAVCIHSVHPSIFPTICSSSKSHTTQQVFTRTMNTRTMLDAEDTTVSEVGAQKLADYGGYEHLIRQ